MADPTGFVINIAIQAAIGLAIAALRPKQDVEGPRLDDTQVSSAAYGKTIPIGYGSDIIGGNIIWGKEIREQAKKYDIGKGNPFSLGTRTEYRYFLTCAVGISQREVKALLGIYADGKLIYDAEAIDGKPSGNLQPFLDNVPEDDRVDDKGNERAPPLIEDLEFNFYFGTLDQEQDPIHAEDVGPEVCPAYRGLAYCVFNDMPLKDLGNRVPQFRFVVTWADPEESDLTFRRMGNPDDALFGPSSTPPVVYDKDRGVVFAFRKGPNGLSDVLDEFGNPLYSEDTIYLEAADAQTGDQLAFSTNVGLTNPDPDANPGTEISYPVNRMTGLLGDTLVGWTGSVGGTTIYDMLGFWDKDTLELVGQTGWPYITELELGTDFIDEVPVPPIGPVNADGGIQAVYIPTPTGTETWVIAGNSKNANGTGGRHVHTLCLISANAPAYGNITYYEIGFNPSIAVPSNGTDLLAAGIVEYRAPQFLGDGFQGFIQTKTEDVGVEGVIFMTPPDGGSTEYEAHLCSVSPGSIGAKGVKWTLPPAGSLAGNGRPMKGFYSEDEDILIIGGTPWIAYDLNPSAIADNGNVPPELWRRDDLSPMATVSETYLGRVSGPTITAELLAGSPDTYVVIDPATGDTLESFTPGTFDAGDTLGQSQRMVNFETGQARGLVATGTTPANTIYGWQYLRPALTRGTERLSEVVRDIVTRGKLTDADIDVTDLEEIFVKGYVIGRDTTYRVALEPLETAYNFQCVERDGKLVFEQKRGTTDVTVPEDDFIRSSNESIFEEELADEKTVPRMIFLTYRSTNLLDEKATQHARQITDTYLTVGSEGDVSTELPLVLSDDEAKQIVERMLYESRLSLTTFKYSLPHQYLEVTPGDVVQFTAAERTDSMRVSEVAVGFNLELELEGHLIDGAVYTQNQVEAAIPYGSPNFTASSIDPLPAPSTIGFVLDLPPILPSMASGLPRSSGSYFAYAAGLPPMFSNREFVGAAGQVSYTEGSDYNTQVVASTGMSYGIVTGGLVSIADPDFNAVQEMSLVMNVGAGAEDFVSVTQQQMIGEGANLAILYNPTVDILEVVRFRDVVENGASNTLTLTGFMRGQRGTNIEALGWDEVTTGITYLILANGDVLNPYIEPVSRQGDTVAFRSVPLGVSSPNVRTGTVTAQMRGLKPFSPSHVALVEDSSGGDYTIQWERRTRGDGQWRNVTPDVPLEEDSEAYEVDILSGTGGSVVRTLTATTQEVAYTAAQISTDFGTLPEPLYCRVYQISAQVGRGYSYEAALIGE